MAFQRPTLNELVDRVQQDFVSRLDLPGGVLRRSLAGILSRVVAGAAHMLHGHVEYLSRQVFPDQSDAEFLVRQASLFGITPKPAQFAAATVTFSGTDGTVIPTGTVLIRSDGAEYRTSADAVIELGAATALIVAAAAGAAGTLSPGTVLSFEAPVAGVSATATAASSTIDGVDQESTESLRARLIDRMRSPPNGGAAADYLAWALAVPGVTRAWVYPLELGEGTVTVRFVRDDDDDLIPAAGEVAEVQDYIDERRPVTAAVSVLAPVPAPLALTLRITPDTAATRAAVAAELADLLRRTAAPGSTVLLSQLGLAIGQAEGLTDFAIQSPSADVPHTTGQLPTLGTITWA